jgi:hypothetical protein
MSGWEHLLGAAADLVWAAFAAHDTTRDAARRMLNVSGGRAAAGPLQCSVQGVGAVAVGVTSKK